MKFPIYGNMLLPQKGPETFFEGTLEPCYNETGCNEVNEILL